MELVARRLAVKTLSIQAQTPAQGPRPPHHHGTAGS